MSRHFRNQQRSGHQKQSFLFSDPEPSQNYQYQVPYSSVTAQEAIYNQITAAINGSPLPDSFAFPQQQSSSIPAQNFAPVSRSRKTHKSSSSHDQPVTNAYSNTITLPEGFTTVAVNSDELNTIQNINNNASFRSLSSNMYEDTSNHNSAYKQTVINNMTRDVLNKAAYLQQSSESETRSYENQVNAPIDTSYGAHRLNIIAAQDILRRSAENESDDWEHWWTS